MQYRETSDPKVAGARVAVRKERNQREEAAVEEVKAQLCYKVLVRAVTKERVGLESIQVPHFDKAQRDH